MAAVIGAVLLAMLLVAPQATVAQAGGSKTIVSGQTVSWNAEWQEEPSVSLVDENVELLAVSRGSSIVGYGGTTFPVAGNELRDTLLEGFASDNDVQQIDRGNYDNVSYSIDISNTNGVALAIFTLVIEGPNSTTMSMLIDSPDRFADAMTAAQAGITIDGNPIFDGVDAAQMQATITGSQGTTAAAPDASPAAPTPASSTPEATPSGGLGDLGDAINGGDQAQTGTTPVPANSTPADTTNAPANSVTVASSGAEVRYSDDWSVQSQDEASVSLGTVGQPAVLVSVIDLGPVAGSMDASVLATGLQEQVTSLADAEVVAALNPSPERMVIVFRDPDDSGTLYRIYDIAVDPTSTTAVTMITAEPDVQAAVQLVSGTVQVNGQPAMTDIPQLVPAIFGASV
jgi:hypothetical protein